MLSEEVVQAVSSAGVEEVGAEGAELFFRKVGLEGGEEVVLVGAGGR